eukprot:TRINITY_DN2790_c0_g1_i1.p1 TRINITY_DN2790_c0_g1~~TRINITY_DN2790_c0_g1_i1.p1  ORF type:complete len:410 (+),score=107.85 TRINITY_DN2790_c0_g1_i1:233-1462(+)
MSASSSPKISSSQPLSENFFEDFSSIPSFQSCDCTQQILDLDGNFCRRTFSRKSTKADREKLRREKINDQFSELASALDPERPKSDKASILIESVQVVKELREELKRLNEEHVLLLDESRELSAEKNELKEEKTALKNETDQLHERIQQQLHAASSWMMINATPFPYHLPISQMPQVPSSNTQYPLTSSEGQTVTAMPPPFVPVAALGAFPLQAPHNTYIQLPAYCSSFNGYSPIERPYTQYPVPLHPMHQCVVSVQAQQGSPSLAVSASNTEPIKPPDNPSHPGFLSSSKYNTDAKQAVTKGNDSISDCKDDAEVTPGCDPQAATESARAECMVTSLTSNSQEQCQLHAQNDDTLQNDQMDATNKNSEQTFRANCVDGEREAGLEEQAEHGECENEESSESEKQETKE